MTRPLRVAWHGTAGHFANYAVKVVRYWLERYGAVTVEPDDSPDLLCSTCSHPRDFPTLSAGRRLADKLRVPYLVGGHEGYTGATLLAWADYVCVGEGYRLCEALAAGGDDPRAVLDAAPNVLRRIAPLAEVTPDYHVPWREIPVIQTAEHGFYAMAGRGCHRKCTFCMTTWVQPHQTAGDALMRRAERQVAAHDSKSGVVFVTNDEGAGRWAGSITVERVLKGYRDEWPMVLRVGVEGITEGRRRAFGKPVTDEQLATLFEMALERKRQLQLFFMVGFPDDPPGRDAFTNLASLIPSDDVRHPRIWLKFTYFESSPHTPLGREDATQIVTFDAASAMTELRRKSGRFRSFNLAQPGSAAWSVCARRLEPAHAAEWLSRATHAKSATPAEVGAWADELGGRGTADGTGAYPWDRVRTSVKRAAIEATIST